MRPFPIRLGFALLLVAAGILAASEKEVVIDFADAVPLLANDKANRVEKWTEQGVVFQLAREPRKSKTKGLLGFFPHLDSGRKGIVCAMATEPIPVRATFPKPVSSVTLELWGSTGTPALVEAFDATGAVVDRARLEALPGRSGPEKPQPVVKLTVRAAAIAYVEWSGPREGEYLAVGEVRFRSGQ